MKEKLLQKIQKLYYDTFYPDGIPLEFGCEFLAQNPTSLSKESKDIKKYIIKRYNPHVKEVKELDDYIFILDTIKIIGKPISITMLLRLIQNNIFDIELGNEKIWFRNKEDSELITFDLSKGDLLRDQDEEVIIKVAELLGIKN